MFSIIIPVGPGRDARTALSSLGDAGLTETDEVIVVGDGHQLVEEAEFAKLPIQYHSLPEARGANAARNHGAGVAKNGILCFLDDDDAYAGSCLTTVAGFIREKPQIGAWSLDWKFRSGKPVFHLLRPRRITERKIRKRNHAGGASSMIVKKAVFESAGGFDEGMLSMQDWDLWLRLSRRGQIRRIPRRLVIYDNLGRNRISTNLKARISGLNHLLQKHGSHWSGSVRAFHNARIAALISATGEGGWLDIFHWKAPLASMYFAFTSPFRQ